MSGMIRMPAASTPSSPVANFAGLLHMTMHSLTKSAIFFAVGHAAQKAGTQMIEQIHGLLKLSPTVGWGLMLGSLAILGLPPFGVFASEFLILTTAMRDHPWAAPILLLALGCYVGFALVVSLLHDFDMVLLARIVGGVLGAGLMVAPMAIVRDLYEGDRMARLMSVIAAVFITVPV